jgi:hypothetical protein
MSVAFFERLLLEKQCAFLPAAEGCGFLVVRNSALDDPSSQTAKIPNLIDGNCP